MLVEELLAGAARSGRLDLPLGPLPRTALLHGHCHQKAFGAMGAVESALRLVPGLEVTTIDSSCCGMAGAFGYHAAMLDASLAMAELALLPAVDVGRSVSRVGGKAQLPAYRSVAGPLRLSYAQYEELETFARFGTRLDPETRHRLERGRRVREVLRQSQYEPLAVSAQIATLLAATEGLFDPLAIEAIADAEERVRTAVRDDLPDLCDAIDAGESLGNKERNRIVETARQALREGRG